MNLLVLCPHFAPDLAPTGEVMTQITEQLVARGHRVHVVTSLPWYIHHAIEPIGDALGAWLADPRKRVAEQVELTVCAGIVGALGFGQRNQSRGENPGSQSKSACQPVCHDLIPLRSRS